jgi:hypothetical protein
VDYSYKRKAPADGSAPEKMQNDDRIRLYYSRLTGLGYFKKDDRLATGSVKKLPPSVTFGTGENRIYILSFPKSAEGQCFLSAQTNQAEQVWRSTFANPLLNERFAQVWRSTTRGPLPKELAGYWSIEESDDKNQVVVDWTGSGVRVRLRFDIASGKLLAENFMPEPQTERPRELPAGNRPPGNPIERLR